MTAQTSLERIQTFAARGRQLSEIRDSSPM